MPKATPKELETLAFSEKKYAIYAATLLFISIPLLYFFLPFLPWATDRAKVVVTLIGLLSYIALTRFLTPKRFAKIQLYVEISVNILAITLIAYFSGGILSPLNIVLIIPVTFAIFLLSSRAGWIFLAVSVGMLAALMFLPKGLSLNPYQAFTLFLIYSIVLVYLASILLFLSKMLIRLEDARKKAEARVSYLEEITRQLKTLDHLKNEFIDRTSHQLRTPLSEISWGLESMLNESQGPLADKQKQYLGKIYQSSQSLIKLVGQLLDLQKIEEEMLVGPYRKAVSIVSVIEKILGEYQDLLKAKKIDVRLVKEDARDAFIDPERFDVAFRNIFENSIMYNKENGSISIRFEVKDEKLYVVIRDTGIGIPASELPFIFKRFTRGSNAARFVANGTGLGLSLAKEILEKQGGSISIQSEENEWTEVTIALPLKTPRVISHTLDKISKS